MINVAGSTSAPIIPGAHTTGKIPIWLSGNALGDSGIAVSPAISGTLTFAKTGTTARAVTFPDASFTVAGLEIGNQNFTQPIGFGVSPTYGVDILGPGFQRLRVVSTNNDALVTIGSQVASSQYWTFGATSLGSGQGSNFFILATSTSTAGSTSQKLTVDSNGNLGITTAPTAGNGLVQLPSTTTTKAGGIGWGDVFLHRAAFGHIFETGPAAIDIKFSAQRSTGETATIWAGNAVCVVETTSSHPLWLRTNGTLALAIDTSQNCVFSAAATSASPTAGIGYSTGAGGTVTQATSKSTAVTLNKVCGTITMNGASLSSNSAVNFTLNNSTIAATDVVVVCIKSGGTIGQYHTSVDAVAAGSCSIQLHNDTPGSLAEAVVLSFAVIKAVAS